MTTSSAAQRLEALVAASTSTFLSDLARINRALADSIDGARAPTTDAMDDYEELASLIARRLSDGGAERR